MKIWIIYDSLKNNGYRLCEWLTRATINATLCSHRVRPGTPRGRHATGRWVTSAAGRTAPWPWRRVSPATRPSSPWSGSRAAYPGCSWSPGRSCLLGPPTLHSGPPPLPRRIAANKGKTNKQTNKRAQRALRVAHLRKRPKATVEPIIENPRGIIWTTLVEDLLMMLYIKYESTGPCSFRQEVFESFILKPIYWSVTYLGNQPEWFEQLW